MSEDFGRLAPKLNVTIQAMQATAAEEKTELTAEQISSKDALLNYLQEAVNPFPKLPRLQKSLESQKARVQKMLKMGEQADRLGPIEQLRKMAEEFEHRNPELKAVVLSRLRDSLKPDDKAEDILKKVMDMYSDVSLADEAMDFLLATTDGDLALEVQKAKGELNKQFGREIAAGRNISEEARAASEKGLGTPTNLRDMYRDVTGNPRDSSTMFQELSMKYAYKELKKVIDFLLHSLGSDMKSKGPSIPRGELHRLLTETRSLQAILGVYRFFRGRMALMERLFNNEGIDFPPDLNFETMAKQFMALVGDRYPSSDKALQTAVRLGLEKWILAKIIALSQFRDAIREVAVNQIYRSLQHRDELYLAILEALEELEDELEELLEKEQEEGEGEEEEGEEEESEEEKKQNK